MQPDVYCNSIIVDIKYCRLLVKELIFRLVCQGKPTQNDVVVFLFSVCLPMKTLPCAALLIFMTFPSSFQTGEIYEISHELLVLVDGESLQCTRQASWERSLKLEQCPMAQ